MYLLNEFEGWTGKYFPVRPDLSQSISILSRDHFFVKSVDFLSVLSEYTLVAEVVVHLTVRQDSKIRCSLLILHQQLWK